MLIRRVSSIRDTHIDDEFDRVTNYDLSSLASGLVEDKGKVVLVPYFNIVCR